MAGKRRRLCGPPPVLCASPPGVVAGGKVATIRSKEEWDAKHKEATNAQKAVRNYWGLNSRCLPTASACWIRMLGAQVVVDFTATWCGPCRMIGPYFEELSNGYDSIIFLKVDVDEVEVS